MLAVEKAHPIKLLMFGEGLEYVKAVLKKNIPDIVFEDEVSSDASDEELISSEVVVLKNPHDKVMGGKNIVNKHHHLFYNTHKSHQKHELNHCLYHRVLKNTFYTLPMLLL